MGDVLFRGVPNLLGGLWAALKLAKLIEETGCCVITCWENKILLDGGIQVTLMSGYINH